MHLNQLQTDPNQLIREGLTFHMTDITFCISMSPDLLPRILNLQTCLSVITTTLKLPSSTVGKGCSADTSAGVGLCQKHHAPSFMVSWGYAHAQLLSRVYLLSTCVITHMINHTRPSSHIFVFWVRGDEANSLVAYKRTPLSLWIAIGKMHRGPRSYYYH